MVIIEKIITQIVFLWNLGIHAIIIQIEINKEI